MSAVEALRGWLPIWIGSGPQGAWVDWCDAEGADFGQPFYSGTVLRLLQHPFNQLFRHRTPVQELLAFADRIPGGEPAGFVFHMSRCGSTLVSRGLATLDHSLAISEGDPLECLLALLEANPDADPALKAGLLRGLLGAFGNARPQARRLFVKFDAWNIHDLPQLRQAFPHTPWIFLYRDPVEVLVSQARTVSGSLTPGSLPPHRIGLTMEAAGRLGQLEYAARALAAILGMARVCMEQVPGGRLVNYEQLPDALWRDLPVHFGTAITPEERERMVATAANDAKYPDRSFSDDRAAKRALADERIGTLARQWLQDAYESLESMRSNGRGIPEPADNRPIRNPAPTDAFT